MDSRFSPSVTGPRPTASSSSSAVTVFDSPCAVRKPTSTPLAVLSAASVFAPVWIVICFASTLWASAEISSSSRGRMRGSISITVTVEPKRAKIEANSIPTAPAPITMRLFGISLSCRISSEVRIVLPSGVMPGRDLRPRAGGEDDVLRVDLRLAALALDHHRASAPRAVPGP